MDPARFVRLGPTRWRLEPAGTMRAGGLVHASEALLRDMDDMVATQLANVAALPGVVDPVVAMPDAHWGYGFPIGAVAAFCVTSTVRSASDAGFGVILPGDALLAFDLPAHDGGRIDAHDLLRMTLTVLGADFARLVRADDVASALAA